MSSAKRRKAFHKKDNVNQNEGQTNDVVRFIPPEIIGSICPILNYNDALRLRHVNKQLKSYADGHLKIRMTKQEIEINETTQTLETILTLSVCSARFYLNVTNPQFFAINQPDITEFLDKHKHKINHLRVRYFYVFSVDGEIEFYEALKNLKSLELEEIDASKRDCVIFRDGKRVRESPFPDNFKNLETLKLGVVHWSRYLDVYYQWDFFNFCEKLVYFKQAIYPRPANGSGHREPYGNIPEAILENRVRFPNGPHLKYFDLGNIKNDGTRTQIAEMIELLALFLQNDVKLVNVHGYILDLLETYAENPHYANLGKPIVSLRNVRTGAFCVEMPNLEKLTIDGTCSCAVVYEEIPFPNPKWPKFKSLNIVVDWWTLENSRMTQLLEFLFKRKKLRREILTKLSLRFSLQVPLSEIPFPKVGPIIATCPNLTKVTLVNYPHSAPNNAFSKLWDGLKFLQEVHLEHCVGLGNAGFVGINVEKPAFLKLKYWKKLTLNSLDKMPKITDTFFKVVLRHDA